MASELLEISSRRKNILVGIDGVNHQIQQFLGFRLKRVTLDGGGHPVLSFVESGRG